VTFLLTDIEGSTRLWEEDSRAMSLALARHDALVGDGIERHGGLVVRSRGEGDSVFSVFDRPADAVAAALDVQRALAAEPWPTPRPLRVRVAIHTGIAEIRDEDLYGPAVNRCARLRSIAHGGQTLLSKAVADAVAATLPEGAALADLGAHRLKDLSRPEQVFQLCHASLPASFPPVRSLEALRHNLPVQLTSFIGRETEMAEVAKLLAAGRLVTVAGAGGAGKTRLALQVAAEVLERFADGVWLVELASTADPAFLPHALASAVGLREEGSRPVADALLDHLRGREALLVLDNCEHLVRPCALLAERILLACPNVRVLATSREPLGVPGETIWRVPPLSLPEPGLPPEAVADSEAVRLFLDRAALREAGFGLTHANAAAVAQICTRLDGIPLAIELAAARVGLLSPEQIAAGLDDRFRLLTGGSRTALPRQQTLRALVDWSYELLDERERLAFARLSVFAGGFGLDAAEAVCGAGGVLPEEVLGLLAQLVDKSLVIGEERGTEVRYRMLDTVRQYAQDRLAASGEAAAVRRRHRDFYAGLVERAEPELSGPDQPAWLDRLESEHDNLRAALEWSASRPDGAEPGLRQAAAMWRFWLLRGHWTEGRARLEAALAQPGDASALARAGALDAAGVLAGYQDDVTAARSLYEEALAIFTGLDDRRGVATVLNHLGIAAHLAGDYAGAGPIYRESLALWRSLGDKHYVARVLNNLGEVAQLEGDHETARALYEEALAVGRELGDRRDIATWLANLGMIARAQKEFERAAALHAEALELRRELTDKWGIVDSLEGLAGVAAERGDHERAARLFGAAEALRGEIGFPLTPSLRADYDRLVALVRDGLGAAGFSAAWEVGRAMRMEAAVAFALEAAG
jgi:predicted ATPase/class 3 adenylate cyclase